jgi:MFS family permease
MAAPTGAPESTWAPLRIAVFRVLWLAVLGSQLGTWMQTVGAQWLLVDQPNAGALVSLVQTAGTLPVLLLALPAGVLADSLDRRRMLIWVQLFQVGVGVALTALTFAGAMTPALLLTLTFALGCGMAMTNPAYQAVIPELVPRPQIPSPAALGSIGMNLARAVGPALAGVLIARTGVAAVFAINAGTFLIFAVALFRWRRQPPEDAGLPEPFVAALRAGGRYVRNSPVMRRLLLRVSLFIVPAVALWALLPLVADRRLGMGAGGWCEHGCQPRFVAADQIAVRHAPRPVRHLSGLQIELLVPDEEGDLPVQDDPGPAGCLAGHEHAGLSTESYNP